MLDRVLSLLVVASLGTSVVRRYLMLNRLWLRKHERSVAESISIVALLLSLATSFPFLAKNLLRHDVKGSVNELVFLASNAAMLFVGIGLFVPDPLRPTMLGKLLNALKLERVESTDLLRSLVSPRGGELLVAIMHGVAASDRVLDPREVAEIQRFSKVWRVPYSPGQSRDVSPDPIALRRDVGRYVALAPPLDEARALRRVLDHLVRIDGVEDPEERIVLGEIFGLLDHYLTGAPSPSFRILVVPQSDEQEDAITALVPDAKRGHRAGGVAYVVGTYCSRAYAEKISEAYRDSGLLTVVVSEEEGATMVPGTPTAGESEEAS
jgi:hypothetical protein